MRNIPWRSTGKNQAVHRSGPSHREKDRWRQPEDHFPLRERGCPGQQPTAPSTDVLPGLFNNPNTYGGKLPGSYEKWYTGPFSTSALHPC
jgi:hypothetical protein